MLNVGNNKSTDEFDYANRIGCRSTERSRKVKQQPGQGQNREDISSGPGVRINGFCCVIEARVERRTK